MLDAARAAHGGAMLVRGDPGIGKTTLLGAACELANAHRMTVLSAAGVESESQLPFAGLGMLLGALLGDLDAVDERGRRALRGALGLGPATADRIGVFTAAGALVAAASLRAPVLAVLDDAQWLDDSSREALVFLARRAHASSVAFLVAARPAYGPDDALGTLDELRLDGLDRDDAAALLAERLPHAPAQGVSSTLWEASGGNPLALIELARLLDAQQRSGERPLDEPLPVGERLMAAFRTSLASVSPPVRRALLVAAADDSGALEPVLRAIAAVAPADALADAEAAGLIELRDGRVRFRHPLVRSTAYHDAAPAERRAAHAALADALDASEHERAAWHRAAATTAADEGVAAELEQMALTARSRAALSESAAAFERAAALTPDAERRAARLLQAGRDALALGQAPRAQALLDAALDDARDGALRADVQRTRARLLMLPNGAPSQAAALLHAEAAKIERRDPARAALMLCDAALSCMFDGNLAGQAGLAERALELAGGEPTREAMTASVTLAGALVPLGESERAARLLSAAEPLLQALEPLSGEWELVALAGVALLWLEEDAWAGRLLARSIGVARDAMALSALAHPLVIAGQLDYRAGRWASARDKLADGIALAEQTGQRAAAAYGLLCHAHMDSASGEPEQCRARLERVRELGAALGLELLGALAEHVEGLAELAAGRAERAAWHLARADRAERAMGLRHGGLFWAGPDLVEARVRAGEERGAEDALAVARAVAPRGAGPRARMQRAAALLAPEPRIDPSFARAIAMHERVHRPFEHARTELCWGERLRRVRRRREADHHLRAALHVFQALGAEPWAGRARRELSPQARTASRRAVPVDDLAGLTPQEREVARLVAQGLTNREAAAALFLSPRTVEFHLRQIYRKLGMRRRGELAARIARQATV